MNHNLHDYPFMHPAKRQLWETQDYVCVPPALIIQDEQNNVWTLGFKGGYMSGGETCWDVLRNGQPVGEMTNRLEYRRKKVRIYGPEGWKTWNGRAFI